MNYVLEVCLVAASLAAGIPPWSVAQSSGAAAKNSRLDVSSENRSDGQNIGGVPPALRRGISVELPATRNARAMPEADGRDALIVTVTEDGGVYFGWKPVDPAALAKELKTSLSHRAEQKLYIKADARTRYRNLGKVILAARTAGVRSLVLLTSQPGSPEPHTLAVPTGFEVLMASPFTAGWEPAAGGSLAAHALAIRPRRRGRWRPGGFGPPAGSITTAFPGLP